MKNIVRLAAAFLLLAGFCALEAAEWDFTLPAVTKAGAVMLNAGEYKVSLRGSVALITDKKSEKSYTVVVKTEDSESKFEHTFIATSKRDGENKLISLSIGGTKTKIIFE